MPSKSKIKRLDTIFSKFIRLRDTNDEGYGKCISSGKFVHYNDADAGHFMSREHMATRWNEKNVHLQSRGDNRFKQGKQFSQALNIDRKYGSGTCEILMVESKRLSKITDFEIEALIKHYRDRARKLAARKVFPVKI